MLLGVGVLVTLAGLLFFLQGIGVVTGSAMSGTTTWSVLGPVIAVAGLLLVLRGARGPRR